MYKWSESQPKDQDTCPKCGKTTCSHSWEMEDSQKNEIQSLVDRLIATQHELSTLGVITEQTTEGVRWKQTVNVESLKNDIELAKGITELTRVTDLAISLLAKAILELDANGDLDLRTVNALTTLAKESTNE